MRTLLCAEGAIEDVSDRSIKSRFSGRGRTGFWLDIEAPDDADYALLTNTLRFHPLTIEDIQSQNQRPKLEEYKGHIFIVLFAAERKDDELIMHEHHLYVSARYIVSVHHEPSPELEQVKARLSVRPDRLQTRPGFLSYMVIDALVDAIFPILETIDEEVDRLQDAVVEKPSHRDLARISDLKHEVTDLRRVLGPQRDLFQRLVTLAMSGEDQELSPYFRDVYDHMVRQYEMVDALRDLLSGVMDVYLSTVSNRLNSTMKTLTVIASLFLPLSFLTGFYGMNFTYLTQRLEIPFWTFWVGVGTMLAATVVQLVFFRRRGWI